MKYEIKVYENKYKYGYRVINAIIRNYWFKYRIDPRSLKYKGICLRDVDERFSHMYHYDESDLERLFMIDTSNNTLKEIAMTIYDAIENVKKKIDNIEIKKKIDDIESKNIIGKCKEDKYIMSFKI